ncbi:Tyrosinase [Psilocybe cubensis]|uniref:tyrosinase n=2 Tax=Psilocybe cubensis TaxID=181762 RepID=A0A8H7XL25_PSICU|nr:Tyrosinase [Psilocybe cubensis]KAH9477628.1 Tyrosinase [Psilocybe cubensis]
MVNRLIVEGAVPKVSGQAPERLEISVFLKDIRQFSLYIQALVALYSQDRNDPASFWQIAGIHGQPYVDYDGTPCDGNEYCVHSTDLFSPWHRPYVVLFEQEIQKLAREIASTYKYDCDSWMESAAALRQPYWGWDKMESVVPPDEIIVETNVQIMKPDCKSLVFVPNPFLTYYYPEGGNSSFVEHFKFRPNTSRYPNTNWISQTTMLKAALRAEAPAIVENTQRLFSLKTWHDFTLGSNGTTGLEGIHNTIHSTTGGAKGNMAYIEVAGKFKVERKTQTDYWQSPGIVDTADTFNYQYAGRAPKASSSEDVAEPAEVALEEYSHAPTSGTILEWSIRVQCKPFALGGSFSVYIFLAPTVPPTDSAQWLFDPTFAGTVDVFANTNPEQCANCTSHANELIKGFVHINRIFKSRSGAHSIDPDAVLPYLRSNLSWGVVKASGEVVEIEKLPSLEVTAMYTPLKPEITRGRTGGHL